MLKFIISFTIAMLTLLAGWTCFAFGHAGAIAFNPYNGRWGVANNQYNIFRAEKMAGSSCGYADCIIAGGVVDGWVALSVGADGGWAAAFSNFSPNEAAYRANSACSQKTSNCRIIATAYGGIR